MQAKDTGIFDHLFSASTVHFHENTRVIETINGTQCLSLHLFKPRLYMPFTNVFSALRCQGKLLKNAEQYRKSRRTQGVLMWFKK